MSINSRVSARHNRCFDIRKKHYPSNSSKVTPTQPTAEESLKLTESTSDEGLS